MKLKKGLILIALAAIIFTACKKNEDDNTPASKTKTEMITTGSWITVDMLYNGASIWALSDPCSKDDFMTFKTNGTVITDEGATKCDPSDPQTTTDNWSLSSDGKKITIDSEVADLTSLTNTDMVVTFTDSADVFVIKMKQK